MSPETPTSRIVVDGETFEVRQRADGSAWDVDWVSGRHEGYGFSTFVPMVFNPAGDAHRGANDEPSLRAAIRSFIAQVDPATGYVG